MMKQRIHDRVRELDQAAYTAKRDAEKQTRAAQRAERQQLKDDCATSGHVMQPRGWQGDLKQCAICGYCDDEPAILTASNLSKG